MKHLCLMAVTLLVLPMPALSQVEIGIDAGLSIAILDEGDNLTTFSIPSGHLRFGFPAGDRVIIEPLLTFALISGDGTFTATSLMPGIVYLFSDSGDSQFYVRGEAGLLLLTGGGESASQLGVGGAVGLRRPAGDNLILRLEGGFDTWFDNDDFESRNELRALVGFSVVVN